MIMKRNTWEKKNQNFKNVKILSRQPLDGLVVSHSNSS